MLAPRLRLAAAAAVALALVGPASGEAEARTKSAAPAGPQPWCAPEIETLPGDVCYLDGEIKTERRTLVIFLHGAVAKNTTWSWNHERGIQKLAKGMGIDVVFPRSPLTEPGYVWPGSQKAQEEVEQSLIDNWMGAKQVLEQRRGRAYDDVFVMGFSSGAYFASSLAMRGRVDVDGYAVFAGGGSMGMRPGPNARIAPVYVGVCADDETTASHSRNFGAALAGAGIPRAVSEQHVGHGLSHVHMNQAVAYLRRNKPKRAS